MASTKRNSRVTGKKQTPSSAFINDPAVKKILRAAGLDRDLFADVTKKRTDKKKRKQTK